MNVFWEIVASNALVVAVLAVVASLLGRVWKNPVGLHLLWVLVLLKLVTPPLLVLPLSLLLARPHFTHFYREGMGLEMLAADVQRSGVGDFLTIHGVFLGALAVIGLLLFALDLMARGCSRLRTCGWIVLGLCLLSCSVPFSKGLVTRILRVASHRTASF